MSQRPGGVTSGIQGQSPDPALGKVPLNLTHKSRSFTLTSYWCLSPRLSHDAGSLHAHHLPGTPLQASVWWLFPQTSPPILGHSFLKWDPQSPSITINLKCIFQVHVSGPTLALWEMVTKSLYFLINATGQPDVYHTLRTLPHITFSKSNISWLQSEFC